MPIVNTDSNRDSAKSNLRHRCYIKENAGNHDKGTLYRCDSCGVYWRVKVTNQNYWTHNTWARVYPPKKLWYKLRGKI